MFSIHSNNRIKSSNIGKNPKIITKIKRFINKPFINNLGINYPSEKDNLENS